MDRGRLLLPLLVLLLPGSVVARLDPVTVSVGQPWEFSLKKGSVVVDAGGEQLPLWVVIESDRIRGIPQRGDLSKHFFKISAPKEKEQVLEVIVKEDVKNMCGNGDTFWVEVPYVEDASLEGQLKAVDEVKEAVEELQVKDLRVLPEGENLRVRKVMEEIGREENSKQAFTVSIPTCNFEEAQETLADVISSEDSRESAYIVRGRLLSRQQRREEVQGGLGGFSTGEPEDLLRTTTSRARTTKRRANNEPVRLNSLPSLQCVRGSVCEMDIPANTFVDAEDGDTTNLSLSVQPDDKWLFVDKTRLKALPLEEGEFEFRLEARDRQGLMASAPFRVQVEQAAPVNHVFVFSLNKPAQKLLSQPSSMFKFVERLASALKDSSTSSISLREVAANGTAHTTVSWSNSSLSAKVCERPAIEAIRQKMLTKNKMRVLVEFIRAMNEEYHVSGVQLHFKGSCDDPILKEVLTTPSPTVEEVEESGLPLVALLVVGVLLLLLLLLLLCCVIARRRSGKAVKNRSTDFETKGQPVVFPEELAEDEAVATTPMLVREERAPLRLTQVDNPLYKPPPPLSHASSPRTVSAASPATQRLPPPYVPP